MNAHALLDDLRSQDVHLEAEEGRLLVDAPAGTFTDELRLVLTEHKPSLLKVLEWERCKHEEAHRRGFVARWSREPGWISLHDPTTGEWYDFPARDCFPSIVVESRAHRKRGTA